VSARLAELDFVEGHAQQAVARLEPALEALTGEEPDEVVAAVAAQLGRFLVLSDEGDRAAPILEQALELAETFGLPETLAGALNSKSVNLMRTDRLYEARVLLEAAVSLALDNDLHGAALRTLNNLTVALGCADRDLESLATIERGLALARRVGDRGWETNLLGFDVEVLIELDRWDEALARVAELEERVTTSFTQSFLIITTRVHVERGDIERARDVLTRNSIVGESEAGQDVAYYALAEARVLRGEGKPAEALAAAERTIAMHTELGMTFYPVKFSLFEALEAAFALGDIAKAKELLAILDGLRPGQLTPLLAAYRARFCARLAAKEGGADVASSFSAAESTFREIDMPFRLAVTQLEHAEWLIQEDQGSEAEPLIDEAHETFERLRAEPWLGRIAGLAQIAGPVATR
jgi:tetratricopeptide (TPR) repeat protein